MSTGTPGYVMDRTRSGVCPEELLAAGMQPEGDCGAEKAAEDVYVREARPAPLPGGSEGGQDNA